MKKRMVSFVIEEELLDRIDGQAVAQGKSRSQALREAVARYVTAVAQDLPVIAHADTGGPASPSPTDR